MKKIIKMAALALVLLMLVNLCGTPLVTSVFAAPASSEVISGATGYTKASDVEYLAYTGSFFDPETGSNITKTIVANWGARGEDCVFLTTYAKDYYTGIYKWSTLSTAQGGTGTSDAYTSDLYRELQDLMTSTHTYYTEYDDSKNVRAFYAYTDCIKNDTTQVSQLYRGDTVTSTWNSGKIWNQEHVWPQSKLNTSRQIGDIMHLRPANPSENTSRGNKAYGESGGYYNPGPSVRGDCARMVLYMYVRWGLTNKMWGSSGVIENLNILLKWMEEDPVDTWEMGRNDAVQSVTGVRNVFVDYPELAWMLFGQEIPENMTTPSGNTCNHSHTELRDRKEATCGEKGYTGDTYCVDCGQKISSGKKISATGEHSFGDWVVTKEATEEAAGTKVRTCAVCGNEEKAQIPKLEAPACDHAHVEVRDALAATCGVDGYSGDTYCLDCSLMILSGSVQYATGAHSFGEWVITKAATGSETGSRERTCSVCAQVEVEEIPVCVHDNAEVRGAKQATCKEAGYSGDTYCTDCSEQVKTGEIVRATGKHSFGQWVSKEDLSSRSCSVCGHSETIQNGTAAQDDGGPWIWILVAAAGVAVAAAVIVVVVKKKKKV